MSEKEKMEQMLRELNEARQETRMKNILYLVEVLLDEANKKDYNASDKERETFGKILTILKNMEGWF